MKVSFGEVDAAKFCCLVNNRVFGGLPELTFCRKDRQGVCWNVPSIARKWRSLVCCQDRVYLLSGTQNKDFFLNVSKHDLFSIGLKEKCLNNCMLSKVSGKEFHEA